MKSGAPHPSVLIAFAIFLSVACARAQLTVTNSATLRVSIEGSNLMLRADFNTTNGAFTIVQGERPDALRLPAYSSQISNQIFDIGWVPAARIAQWTLTNWSATPARFFRLEFEPVLSRGRALVFRGGPLDFDAMRRTYGAITNSPTLITNEDGFIRSYQSQSNTTPAIFKQPVEVWVDNLGIYDANGVLVGGNGGRLTGKFSETQLYTINYPEIGLPTVPRLFSTNNDFRVNFMGDLNASAREAVLWSSEVQAFHDINEYRTRFLNEAFIEELKLPPQIQQNVKNLQYRPDLGTFYLWGDPLTNRAAKPRLGIAERSVQQGGINLYPWENSEESFVRTRSHAPYPDDSLPPLSMWYDSEACVGDYSGIVAFWAAGTNTQAFTSDAFFGENQAWQTNVLPALNDGLNAWVGYITSGNCEVYKYFNYAVRIWHGRPCGGTNIPCDKGQNIRNVMMFDEADTSHDGVFPYTWPYGFLPDGSFKVGNSDGPVGSDLSALYVAAIFYDIANEAGLGVRKADLLIWKSISLTTGPPLSIRSYGTKVQEAARALWPDPRPGRAGLSLYEEDINDVLTSRGIPLNGVSDFRTNLPPTFAANSPFLERTNNAQRGFGTSTPMLQPGASYYGQFSGNFNGYTITNIDVHYVAYQFYKHSKLGPADVVGLSDGTFNGATGTWNNDVTYQVELTDRTPGNLVVLAPGRTIRWFWKGARATNEAEGFYAEDVQPFGFRVIQAMPNGFSFTASVLSETTSNKTYQLTVVDPSVATLGAANYAWNFTNYLGHAETATGISAQYAALKDQPFTLSITRTRASETNTLTLRERGNDLDRNSGNAFVRNLVP